MDFKWCPRVGASLHSLHVPRALLGELHNLPFPLSLLPGHRSQPDYFSSLSPQFSVDLKAMVVEGSFFQFLSSFKWELFHIYMYFLRIHGRKWVPCHFDLLCFSTRYFNAETYYLINIWDSIKFRIFLFSCCSSVVTL